jgi:hypothetical protein
MSEARAQRKIGAKAGVKAARAAAAAAAASYGPGSPRGGRRPGRRVLACCRAGDCSQGIAARPSQQIIAAAQTHAFQFTQASDMRCDCVDFPCSGLDTLCPSAVVACTTHAASEPRPPAVRGGCTWTLNKLPSPFAATLRCLYAPCARRLKGWHSPRSSGQPFAEHSKYQRRSFQWQHCPHAC